MYIAGTPQIKTRARSQVSTLSGLNLYVRQMITKNASVTKVAKYMGIPLKYHTTGSSAASVDPG